MSTIGSSEQALQQALNPQVARIALHVYDNHAQFQRALLELARQYNLRLPVNLTPQDQSRLASLSAQQGAAFDQAYIQQLAQSNTSSISQFQSAASTVNNADVQGYQIPNFPANGNWHEWTKDYDVQSGYNQLTIDMGEYEAQVFVWQ